MSSAWHRIFIKSLMETLISKEVKRSTKLLFIAIILIAVLIVTKSGIDSIRSQVENMGVWAPIVILCLRSTSIVIPALPSTVYSLLAGGLLGFKKGIIIICLADFLACSIAFIISRIYGKNVAKKLIGNRFIIKVEDISKKHLEKNFFLMTGLLMTGLFDFVSYAIGLTKTPWIKFAPALGISILLSNPPIVALGAGVLEGGKLIVLTSLLAIFALSLISYKLNSISRVPK